MRITYDPSADAAYLYLTDEPIGPGRETIDCEVPADAAGSVLMDWKDGRLVGLEVLSASSVLHPDLLKGETDEG